jgi:hypothetical protein
MSVSEHPTVQEIVDEVKDEICIGYCKFREAVETDDDFDNLIIKCAECPLNRL